MERASLLLDAHFYQDHADQAQVGFEALRDQIERLDAECQTMQASLGDLINRADAQVQEVC